MDALTRECPWLAYPFCTHRVPTTSKRLRVGTPAAHGPAATVRALAEPRTQRLRSAASLVRVGLAVFVAVWLFGPDALRAAVPVWLPFLVALGLELQFFLTARRAPPGLTRPDRRPQEIDRELYGYPDEPEDEDEVAEDDELDWEPADPRRAWPLPGLLAGVGVIAALAALAWFVESRSGWSGLDADTRAAATERFSDEAARIAGRPVEIHCDESGERVGFVQHTDGVAEVGGRLAYLTPDRCHELYRLAFEGSTSDGTARAIAVLAHEAWHLRGVRDESTTECYSLQSGVELGQRLGLSEERARRLMRRALTENAGRSTGFEYRVGPACRDGGELDLNPETDEFP